MAAEDLYRFGAMPYSGGATQMIPSQDNPSPALASLFVEAVTKYREQCLWNIDPQVSPQGLTVIVLRLRKYGDMDAWRLAGRIERSLADAAG
jgi:hypothetical protein